MSQVNFFMTATDEIDFADYLANRGDTLAVAGLTFSSPHPARIDLSSHDLPLEKHITLLHSELSQSPSRRDDDLYVYDMFRDAFIQFTRCQHDHEVMVSGRIYAKIGWLKDTDGNKLYLSWYGSIESWIKKRYIRLRQDWWVGPDAERWSRAGGQLALGNKLARHVSLADKQAE